MELDISNLKNKFINVYNNDDKFIKLNVPVISKYLEYKGWSIVDGKPIYEYIGDDFVHFRITNKFDDLSIKPSKASRNELSLRYREENDAIVLS